MTSKVSNWLLNNLLSLCQDEQENNLPLNKYILALQEYTSVSTVTGTEKGQEVFSSLFFGFVFGVFSHENVSLSEPNNF